MKKLILVSAIAMSGLIYQNANAQIGVHFNINLGVRPVVVAPAPVYDADYYYLPDVEAYYSVSQHSYYYQDGGAWISAAYLPGVYRDYDWQYARHFAVNEARPYLHNDVYRARYGGFEGHRDWNYRDQHSAPVYADRNRLEHGPNNRASGHNWDNQRNDNRNDHQQPSQPQNNNRGNGGNDHQQSKNNDHGNDNNRGNNDNSRQGRGGRF